MRIVRVKTGESTDDTVSFLDIFCETVEQAARHKAKADADGTFYAAWEMP